MSCDTCQQENLSQFQSIGNLENGATMALMYTSLVELFFECGSDSGFRDRLYTDKSDLTSVHSFDETLRMAYLAESTIYAIGTTRFGAGEDARGDDALEKLTESTGGTVFFPHSSNNLAEVFKTIDTELRSQYNLTYVPTNRKKDDTFRKIEIEVKADDVRVRHRVGYYAPYDPMDKWKQRALEREQRRFEEEQEKTKE